MNRRKSSRKYSFLLIILFNILLIFAVLSLMKYVQKLLASDVQINLTEIVTQNRDVIDNKLNLEVNNVELIAQQIADRYSQTEDKTPDALKTQYLDFASARNDTLSFLALPDGTALFSDSTVLDVGGRNYFKVAIKGTENISERIISRLDGEAIFIISVPIKYDGAIIGTIQKPYTPEEMYELCSVSLFSKQGDMYIINSEGYILFSSRQDIYNLESDNYYRLLCSDNAAASKKLESNIKQNQAGFMETIQGGIKYFSAYMPITRAYDWYLITSVETSAASPNANTVIQLFYVILFVLVMVFCVTLIVILRMKRKQNQNLERIALVDEITGGNTFACFKMRIEGLQETPPKCQYYILTFNIDNFKYINNFYGFDAGDRILKAIYENYCQHLAADECCARVYNDHFVLLLSDASDVRLDELYQPEFTYDNITVYLSAGLYPITSFDESVNLMIDKASMAEQKSKGLRGKRVEVYSQGYDKRLMESEQTKRAVEQALFNDEIVAYFQPKVDVMTNTLVGAEALARWKTEDGTIIPPARFIPVCEQSGLIEAVDFAVLEKTLQFLKQSLDEHISCVPISVNLSRYHLLNENFMDAVLDKLKQYQVPSHLIEFELTETVMFDNFQVIIEFIEQLHANGFLVSMDDFGTGYSSLHMLKDIDLDVLKIDRSFLLDTVNSSRQCAIFAAIVQMAHSIDIKVVVEGVETLDNVLFMKDLDCHIAQGYFYSKPIDEAAFQSIVKKGFIE